MSKKILLVDDDRILLKFASDLLEKEGHEVATAQDGFAALNLLTSFYPDIMFFDLIMPKIDGDKLCHIVRKMPHLKDCYLVILSAAVAELDFDHTEIGADAYIAKGPFNVMGKHVLAAIEASEVPRKDDEPKPIKGLESIYARQLTKELLSRNRHLETVLESLAEGILEVFSGKVVYANAAAISMFGMDKGNLLAFYPPDLFEGEVRSKLANILKSGTQKPSEIGTNNPIHLDHLVVYQHLGEGVAKIMRHSGSNCTDGLHFLNVLQPHFQLFAFGDIGNQKNGGQRFFFYRNARNVNQTAVKMNGIVGADFRRLMGARL